MTPYVGWATWRRYLRDSTRCWDFRAAIGTASLVMLLTATRPDTVRDAREGLLGGVAALGLALLAVVVTSIAILAALSANYRFLLARTKGGIQEAFLPYLLVCALSAGTSTLSLLGIMLGGTGPEWMGVAGAGALAMVASWALYGTLAIAFITARHAATQGSVDELVEEARQDVANTRRATPSPKC